MADAPTFARDTTPDGSLEEARLHRIIGYQVAQASIATLDVFQRRVGSSLGLRPVEFTVLALIRENPGGLAGHLAKALAVTPPNITAWLDKLERRGLVRRVPSASDRRLQHLYVTERGAAICDTATQQVLEAERERFAALSPAERTLLIELLHKVACARGEAAAR